MKRQNVRTLALIVCTFTYLLIGAAVFDHLESAHEYATAEKFKTNESNWKARLKMNDTQFDEFFKQILQMKAYKAGTQWKFAGSFYFATTVITTIGYGHSTPKTENGKMFCMLYALCGIPLCIVMFQSIGERMNVLLTAGLRKLKQLFRAQDPTVSQTHLILVSVNLGVLVLTAGAGAFAFYEEWEYLDALYYCFITLTTIGFGDFVALQRNDSLSKRPDYVAFSLIFILFGLTVVSSAMNLLVLRFLTMNTEDERRDEIEAAIQAHDRGCLQGDVIVSNGRSSSAFLCPVPGLSSKRLSVMQLVEYHSPPMFTELKQLDPTNYSYRQQPLNDNNMTSLDEEEKQHLGIPCLLWCCGCCLQHSPPPAHMREENDPEERRLFGRTSSSHSSTFQQHVWSLPCYSNKAKQHSQSSHYPPYSYNSHSWNQRRHFTVIRSPGTVHHLADPILVPPNVRGAATSREFVGGGGGIRNPATRSPVSTECSQQTSPYPGDRSTVTQQQQQQLRMFSRLPTDIVEEGMATFDEDTTLSSQLVPGVTGTLTFTSSSSFPTRSQRRASI